MCDHLKTPMNHSVELGKALYIAFEFAGKYPLHGYILGVLTHTTAWDRLWGGDETLKSGIAIRLGESILTW